MRKPLSHRLLHAIALALSSITMFSVAMAMLALIPDRTMAIVFAAAAVLLDAFKYLAWPLATGYLGSGRPLAGGLVMGCALILAGVSGWATYDRMLTSMTAAQARQQAITTQRITDLQATQADARARLAVLDAEAESIRQQAAQLRARSIVTKAGELEASALPRIAEQRARQVERIDQASLELTALRSQTATTTTLPALLAGLLAAGFALALELVPALILSTLRGHVATAATPVATPATAVATAAMPVAMPATLQQQPALDDSDSALMKNLLDITRATPAGQRITVSNITTAFRIGNRRAMALLKQASQLGAVTKTRTGYIATAA